MNTTDLVSCICGIKNTMTIIEFKEHQHHCKLQHQTTALTDSGLESGEMKDDELQVRSFEEEYNRSLDPFEDTDPVANNKELKMCPKCFKTAKASELMFHIEICPWTEFQRSANNDEVAFSKIPLGLIKDKKYKSVLSTSTMRISAKKGSRENSYKIFISFDGNVKKIKLIFKYKTFLYTISVKQNHSKRRLQLPSYIESNNILKLKVIREL